MRFKCLHPLSVYHVIGDRGTFVVIHLPYRKTRLKKTSASQLLGVLSFADLVLLRSTINVLEIEAPPWSTRENRQCSCCSPSSSPGPLRKKVSLLWRYAGLRKTMPDFEHLHEMKTLTIQGAYCSLLCSLFWFQSSLIHYSSGRFGNYLFNAVEDALYVCAQRAEEKTWSISLM